MKKNKKAAEPVVTKKNKVRKIKYELTSHVEIMEAKNMPAHMLIQTHNDQGHLIPDRVTVRVTCIPVYHVEVIKDYNPGNKGGSACSWGRIASSYSRESALDIARVQRKRFKKQSIKKIVFEDLSAPRIAEKPGFHVTEPKKPQKSAFPEFNVKPKRKK